MNSIPYPTPSPARALLTLGHRPTLRIVGTRALINGCSDLILELFGADIGAPSRVASTDIALDERRPRRP